MTHNANVQLGCTNCRSYAEANTALLTLLFVSSAQGLQVSKWTEAHDNHAD